MLCFFYLLIVYPLLSSEHCFDFFKKPLCLYKVKALLSLPLTPPFPKIKPAATSSHLSKQQPQGGQGGPCFEWNILFSRHKEMQHQAVSQEVRKEKHHSLIKTSIACFEQTKWCWKISEWWLLILLKRRTCSSLTKGTARAAWLQERRGSEWCTPQFC